MRGRVQVRCNAGHGGRTRISFQDTGEGLSADKLAQLFQPFNRLGQEAGVEEGTGIGLVVSKRLVELMGGEIGADGTVGVGSVFWIELDSAQAPSTLDLASEPLLTPAPMWPPGTPMRTELCVHDNPANLMLIEKLLARRPDLRLLTARDGNSGIELARASRPDVILMDINLPGISGLQAMDTLALYPEIARIPVVALSANAVPGGIEKGLEAGFFRYLTMPLKVTEFMDTLDLALASCAASAGDLTALGGRASMVPTDKPELSA